MAGCVCNRVQSVPAASASPDLPKTSGPRSTCSRSQRANNGGSHGSRQFDSQFGREGVTTHLGFLILRVVLPVDVARGGLVRDAERGVADLRREVVLEVEEARLAHVARLCAGLADDRRLEAHARARVPAEHGERPGARSAFPSKLLL